MVNSIALLFVTAISVSGALPPLKGRVVCAQTNEPLDSVRVTSTLFASSTRTDSSGRFTLLRESYRSCGPETLVSGSYDEYRIRIASENRRVIVNEDEPVPATVLMYDLRGRLLQKSDVQQTVTPFPGRMPSAGIYLVAFGGQKPRRVIVAGNGRPGTVLRRRFSSGEIILHACPAGDTVVFCKDGYRSAALFTGERGDTVSVTLLRKQWLAFDLHNHTVLTDGSYIFDSVLIHSFGEGGLDVMVNSEHGGAFASDTTGAYLESTLPRWESLRYQSWPKIISMRSRYPEKVLLQGVEWNCPGHEHASVGFIDDTVQPAAIAEFEYRFDFNDYDVGMPWLTKSNDYLHSNALTALEWLQSNFAETGYFFINHPSREAIGPYNIEHFRDFHRMAPDVFIGFEGMPGHHRKPTRGNYGQGGGSRNRTWGGADYCLAHVGGLWDALLGEGRRLWIIVNSDFHTTAADFWPGVYTRTGVAANGHNARAWLDGMKSGEMFVALGDLLSELDFTIDDSIRCVSMGGTLATRSSDLLVTIRFTCPATDDNGGSVRVDHIDLISGAIGSVIDPSDPAYRSPVNPTTRVLRRFTTRDWTIENGTFVIRTKVRCTRSTYFRLRGTSLAVGTPGEVDGNGNPLMDEDYMNTDSIAWRDRWFYSNPVFVYKK
jgi:hypothetical protein